MCFSIQGPQKRLNLTIRHHPYRHTIFKGHHTSYFSLLRPDLGHQDQEVHTCNSLLTKAFDLP